MASTSAPSTPRRVLTQQRCTLLVLRGAEWCSASEYGIAALVAEVPQCMRLLFIEPLDDGHNLILNEVIDSSGFRYTVSPENRQFHTFFCSGTAYGVYFSNIKSAKQFSTAVRRHVYLVPPKALPPRRDSGQMSTIGRRRSIMMRPTSDGFSRASTIDSQPDDDQAERRGSANFPRSSTLQRNAGGGSAADVRTARSSTMSTHSPRTPRLPMPVAQSSPMLMVPLSPGIGSGQTQFGLGSGQEQFGRLRTQSDASMLRSGVSPRASPRPSRRQHAAVPRRAPPPPPPPAGPADSAAEAGAPPVPPPPAPPLPPPVPPMPASASHAIIHVSDDSSLSSTADSNTSTPTHDDGVHTPHNFSTRRRPLSELAHGSTSPSPQLPGRQSCPSTPAVRADAPGSRPTFDLSKTAPPTSSLLGQIQKFSPSTLRHINIQKDARPSSTDRGLEFIISSALTRLRGACADDSDREDDDDDDDDWGV